MQRLLGLLALLGLAWAVRRLFTGARIPRAPGGRPVGTPKAAEGPMVRDHVCNTFLPRASALRLTRDDGEHFFCSERCRRRFLDRPAS